MNRPKAARARLKLLVALTAIAAVAAIVPAVAGATMTTTATGLWGPNPNSPITPVPGAHDDYTIRQDFTYSAMTEDLKKWIVDSPAGQIGNPNMIPWDDRCTIAQFNPATQDENLTNPAVQTQNSNCPATSKVGQATVTLAFDVPFGPYSAGDTAGVMTGDIYILQSSPEIPVKLATNLTPSPIASAYVCGQLGKTAPCQVYPKTMSYLAPVTNQSAANNGVTDFRIRTVPEHYSSRPVTYPVADAPGPVVTSVPLHITRIDQHLFGTVNGQPFLTNPMRCDAWDSQSYALAYDSNDGTLPMDPKNPGDLFVASAAQSQTPDCSGALPPLGATASATLSTGERNANPSLTVTISDPNAANDDQPQKVVTTLPGSVTNDVDSLANLCSIADRDADNCPANTQVGTATVKTPLISAGLTGKVYKTKRPPGDTSNLPNLSIFVDGAINFRLDATTKFAGPQFNQLETTFDNLPQAPFTEFTVNISGGTGDSLLLNRECPIDGALPADGPVNFTITGHLPGQTNAASSPTTMAPCRGVLRPENRKHCIRQNRSARFRPQGLLSRADVTRVQLMTGRNTKSMHVRATRRGGSFELRRTMNRRLYHRGWSYRYGYRVTYKDGFIIRTKTARFRICR